jgi:transcriptional regulator with XRE-family HTH domain
MKTNPNFPLKQLRKALGLGQSEMAGRMGLSLRPYQQLELNPDKIRSRHIRLAESVALDRAIEKQNPKLAPSNVRRKVIKLARLIAGKNLQQNALKLAEILLDQG